MSSRNGFDAFLRGYLECALWASVDYDTEKPMDEDHTVADLAPEALDACRADCRDFYDANLEDIGACRDDWQSGHDFWLTRNHHGAGFWDRGLGKVGERLTKSSHVYGSANLYIGDDGRVYVQ